MSTEASTPSGGEGAEQPRCPTCGERDSEDIGQDVRRCRNCTYVWIPIAPEGDGTMA